MLGVSKATYGWIGRSPTTDEARKVTSQVWRVAGNGRNASPHLRNVLEGRTPNVEAVIGCRKSGLLICRYRRINGDIQWKRARGTLGGTFGKRLKSWVWSEVGPLKWRHEGLATAIDLTSEAYSALGRKQEQKLLMHECEKASGGKNGNCS